MITNNNYNQLCNLLKNLYNPERLIPRFNNRSRRGQLNEILNYDTAYGENRDDRASKMKRGEIPRTVAQGENPENPGREWINKYVNKASLQRVINERNGIVIVRSQKYNVRSIPNNQLFQGIRLNRGNFNGVYNYYVKVENNSCSNCSCPDRLERNVECKHMKLVAAMIREQQRASAIERRLQRLGIDPRNIRRATRRRPRNASSRISTRTRLFQ